MSLTIVVGGNVAEPRTVRGVLHQGTVFRSPPGDGNSSFWAIHAPVLPFGLGLQPFFFIISIFFVLKEPARFHLLNRKTKFFADSTY